MILPDNSFPDFSTYLLSTGTSRNTYKNYLSDIRYFLSWLKESPLTDENLNMFREHLSSTQPIKTANRRLSSVRKFCHFLNLPTNITNLSSQPAAPPDPILPMLKNFSSYLKSTGASDSTVKNYLSDTRHFYEFLQTQSPPPDTDTFSLYRQYLMLSSSPATISRRLSSVKKFLEIFPLASLLPAPATIPAPVDETSSDSGIFVTQIVESEDEKPAPTLPAAPDTTIPSDYEIPVHQTESPIIQTETTPAPALVTSDQSSSKSSPLEKFFSTPIAESVSKNNLYPEVSATHNEPAPAPIPIIPAISPQPKKTLKIHISDRTIYIVAAIILTFLASFIGYAIYKTAFRSPALIDPTLP